jgi:hypothetical protein
MNIELVHFETEELIRSLWTKILPAQGTRIVVLEFKGVVDWVRMTENWNVDKGRREALYAVGVKPNE